MAIKREIIPAILTKNLTDFKNKLKKISNFTYWLQIDIMDGKFVNNTSIKLTNLKKIKFLFNLEIHLMVFNPERYFRDCQRLKAKRVIFHWEAIEKNPLRVLKEMEKYSFEKGIAINPGTSVAKIEPYLKYFNLILLLGVTPGFQGQKFNPIVLRKIKQLKLSDQKFSIGVKKIKIGVDGGVNLFNINKIAKAGADNLVVGSYLFRSPNLRKSFSKLKNKLAKIN